MSNDQSLSERIEFPTIPLEAQTKIAQLQEQFVRAEVEQCKSLSCCSFFRPWGCLLHLIGLDYENFFFARPWRMEWECRSS